MRAFFCFQGRGKRGFDMPDLHDERPRLAALYDLACGWSEDRDFYLWLAKGGAKSILDLGCGTGPICDAYAAGGHATGADPSARMLDIAGGKPNGCSIEWVECCSQDFRSEKRCELIVMTGHPFSYCSMRTPRRRRFRRLGSPAFRRAKVRGDDLRRPARLTQEARPAVKRPRAARR